MISVFGSSLDGEELQEVESCLRAQWMGAGPKVDEFEREFEHRLALPGFVMVNSGSNALYLAVKLLDLPPASEVILPSFTWVACAHAVALCGCVPVFCDVDEATQNVTAETIAPCITPRTRAVMVVHYAGKPVDLGPILELGLPVIEDAAHAVDSQWRGAACGSAGDLGVFSFDAVKNLATPDAGGLTARDPDLLARARHLRYCGVHKSGFDAASSRSRWWVHSISEVSPKLLPNDVAAAIALAQLRKLDDNQARRRRIWDLYQEEFRHLDWLLPPIDAAPGERHSYFTYCVRVAAPADRDRLAAFLYDREIYTTLRYHPLHLSPVFRSSAVLPVSERLSRQALNLPIHPRLSDADVDLVVSAIRAFEPAGQIVAAGSAA